MRDRIADRCARGKLDPIGRIDYPGPVAPIDARNHRMKSPYLAALKAVACLLVLTPHAMGQEELAPHGLFEQAGKRGSIPAPRERNDRPIDVSLYELDLRIFAGSDSLAGTVRIEFSSLAPSLASAVFDFSNDGMTVDAVLLDGAPASYSHADELIDVALPGGLSEGASASVSITYHGRPGREKYGLSSFVGGYKLSVLPDADGRPDFGAPVHATLSEPTAARAWWPCHDTPYDAAAVRLRVTGPAEFELASAGMLEGRVDHADGTATTSWWMPAPIPAYLVSIAMADYESWTETAIVTDPQSGLPVEMPVQHYANAARRPHAEFSWQNTVEMIEYFDRTISPYPYHDLKYGHALFNFGGAMEHPTMSSMGGATTSLRTSAYHDGPAADWIVAHELVHQWFGDSLRLERWGEIWLNEAFASYGEILWLEHKYGADAAKKWLVGNKLLDYYPGTIRDPQAPLSLFGVTVYDKGAWVMHMLRQLLGDEGFIESLRRYAERHRFQAVNTDDFRIVCEEVHREDGGTHLLDDSLDWFFTQWLDRVDRPALSYEWSQGPSGTVRLRVRQSAPAYRLPLPIELEFADGSSERRVVTVDGEDFSTQWSTASALRRLAIDPDGDWLLTQRTPVSSSLDQAVLLHPYPNPFNPRVAIAFFLRSPASVELGIYDLRGRLVRRLLDGPQPAGLQQRFWDGYDESGDPVGSAVYLVRLESSDGGRDSTPITLLR